MAAQAKNRGFFSRLFGRNAPEPQAAGAHKPAPPPAGPATHPNERGPEEREPGTRKKGTPDDPRPKKPPKQARTAEVLDAPPPNAPHPIPSERPEERRRKGSTME